jgi:hypothetical protein
MIFGDQPQRLLSMCHSDAASVSFPMKQALHSFTPRNSNTVFFLKQ